MKKLEKQYNNVCEQYIKQFCKKQDMDFEFWVAGIVGHVCLIGDFYLNFSDIVWDINSNQPKGNIIRWYDQCLDTPENSINYYTYTQLP